MSAPAPHPGFRSTVAALSAGQLLSWAVLYYGFSSFVLPMMADTGWSKPQLMGALTLGLTVWGAATYGVGSAIDRGHGRALMTLGTLLTVFVVPTMYTLLARRHAPGADKRAVSEAGAHDAGLIAK